METGIGNTEKENKKKSRRRSKEELEIEQQNRRRKILELLKLGKTIIEITKETKISKKTIERDVESLIDEGLIKKEEVISQRDKNAIVRAQKIEKIKELLKEENLTYAEIARKVGISETMVRYVKNGTYENYINGDMVGIKITNKQDDEYIKLLKMGLTFEEIAKLKKIEDATTRNTLEDRLRNKYSIDEEQLKLWREQRRKRFEEGQKAIDIYIYIGKGTASVQKFFNDCLLEKQLGRTFSKEEIRKFGRVIFMDERAFLDLKNLRFVMMGYTELFDYRECNEYLNKLLRTYADTEYGEAIREFIKEYNIKINEQRKNKAKNKVSSVGTWEGDEPYQ